VQVKLTNQPERPATPERVPLAGFDVTPVTGLSLPLMGDVVVRSQQIDHLIVILVQDRLREGDQVRLELP